MSFDDTLLQLVKSTACSFIKYPVCRDWSGAMATIAAIATIATITASESVTTVIAVTTTIVG